MHCPEPVVARGRFRSESTQGLYGGRLRRACQRARVPLTPCAYCGDLIEHPKTDRVRYSSDGGKQRAMIVNGVVVHEWWGLQRERDLVSFPW